MPVRKGGWWYYSRTVEGQQYAIHCRRAVRRTTIRPPMTEDGAPLEGEEVLLDGNELAGDSEFFALGAFDVSPDGTLLAYSTDFAGDERYTLRVKDLATGRDRCRRDPRHVLRLRLVGATAPRCSTSPSTTRGGRTGSGGTARHARPPTT